MERCGCDSMRGVIHPRLVCALQPTRCQFTYEIFVLLTNYGVWHEDSKALCISSINYQSHFVLPVKDFFYSRCQEIQEQLKPHLIARERRTL